MKNYDDTIGNRTRELPARSAVPQPIAGTRGPVHDCIIHRVRQKQCIHTLTKGNSTLYNRLL